MKLFGRNKKRAKNAKEHLALGFLYLIEDKIKPSLTTMYCFEMAYKWLEEIETGRMPLSRHFFEDGFSSEGVVNAQFISATWDDKKITIHKIFNKTADYLKDDKDGER